MKKVFTLMMFALLSVGSAWADTKPTIDGVDSEKVPDAPTVTLDLSSQEDFTASESGWIVFNPKAEGVEKKDYWTNNVTNGNNRTWAVPSGATAPFVGSGDGEKTCFAVHKERVHSLRFTGAETLSVLGKSGGTSRSIMVSLYTYDGTTFTLVDTKSDKSNNVVEILFTDLNTSTNYVAYFYGSDAKNNSDLYEVAIKSPSTAPSISAADATIKVKKSGDTATEEIGIEGANLTGSTLTATLSPAVDGLNVTLTSDAISSGSISTKATLTYTPTTDTNGKTTLTLSDGAGATKEVTITYVAKLTYSELEAISEAATWDFSKNITGAVEFSGADQNTEYVYADIPDFENLTITGDEFNSKALAFKGQYPFRGNSNKYAMNGTLHFKTLYPGHITVTFSDTGTSASATAAKRYLVVNGQQTEYWTSRENNGENGFAAQLNVTAEDIYVPAGDVYITGSSSITMSYLSFTPDAAASIEVTIDNGTGYRTFVSGYNTDWSKVEDVEAYTAKVSDGSVTFTKVEGIVPAGQGLLLKGDDDTYTIPTATTVPETFENDLVGVLADTKVAAGAFVLYDDKAENGIGFYKTKTEFTVGANTAYLKEVAGARMFIALPGGETTGVNAIEAAEATDGKMFDLQGRQVSKPTKGLYISNGKKYIVK